MFERSGKSILLMLIVGFSFAYRLLLLTWNTFPPGADIGMHESVIKSITQGQTDFAWNFYNMGGGTSVTNPGYHIFVAFIISMTGLPDYIAQAIVAAFFSSLTVLCVFLLVRRLFGEKAGLIASVLAVFSAGDIAILNWGGYPNIVTLMLIPAVFYLFFQRQKFSTKTFLVTSSLIIGAMFLTHVFTALVFLTITIVALLAGAFLSKRVSFKKADILFWLLPSALGAAVASPYLIEVAPVYLSPQLAVAGSVSLMKQALLQTRLIPSTVVILSLIPALLVFLLSKLYKGKFFTFPAFLFAAWILVPAVLTQSYLFGIYLDYERFLYFLFLPTIICVALLIEVGSNFLSNKLSHLLAAKYERLRAVNLHRNASKWPHQRNLIRWSPIALVLMILSLVLIPIFTLPNDGLNEANYYQVMTPAGYEGVQWIKANTPVGSVCVADADYGWWLSGFAQRPTLSAVAPENLILAREFEPAKVASSLLKTDYYIGNGLIQVENNGTYVTGQSPLLIAYLNSSYIHYSLFNLNDTEISIIYRENGAVQYLEAEQIPLQEIQVESSIDKASISVKRENQLFSFVEETTVYRGVRFANITVEVKSKKDNVQLDWIHFPFHPRGSSLQDNNTFAVVDGSMQVIGQIVFDEGQLGSSVSVRETPRSVDLVYNLEGERHAKAQFFAGAYPYQVIAGLRNQSDYVHGLVVENARAYLERVSDDPVEVFNYELAIREWNIAYVAVREANSIPRFLNDPLFNLVFKNSEVAIFKVNLKQ